MPDPEYGGFPLLDYQLWVDHYHDPSIAGWSKVQNGPADESGEAAGEFEDGPPPWKQV